jgi:uncharacterized protein
MIRFIFFAGGVVILAWGFLWLVFGEKEDQAELDRHAAYLAEAEILKTKAKSGHVDSQFALAQMYRKGRGVDRDAGEAARLYRAAATAGHVGAIYTLGELYENGEGVRESYHRAAEWYALAARLGHGADAEFAMGLLYFYGRGVIHDYNDALDWFRKAAGKGHPAAQFIIGSMYAEGWGLKRDYIQAYMWYTLALSDAAAAKAADPDFDPAAARDVIQAKMNSSQIAKAKKRAAKWRPARR